MYEQDYITKIKKLSNKKIIEEYSSLLDKLESNNLSIKCMGELMQKERNNSKYKNLNETIHKMIDDSNEYQNKMNHIKFEINYVRKINDLENELKKIRDKK